MTFNHILLVSILIVHSINPIDVTAITCWKVTPKSCLDKFTKWAKPKQIELKIADHNNT